MSDFSTHVKCFLIFLSIAQVALVIELKDKESISMYNNALELLSNALEVWPNANVKFNYLEKILGSIQPSQSRDPAAALAQGLDVMNKALEKQPQLFIRNNINHIAQASFYSISIGRLIFLKNKCQCFFLGLLSDT